MDRLLKVLIADDESVMRRILKMYCRQAGYEATLAENGREALAHTARSPFELIVTDYQMPLMDGLEFCRQLRQQARHQLTPIILVSSAITELAIDAISLEIKRIAFVAKPLDRPGFLDLLHTSARSAKDASDQ